MKDFGGKKKKGRFFHTEYKLYLETVLKVCIKSTIIFLIPNFNSHIKFKQTKKPAYVKICLPYNLLTTLSSALCCKLHLWYTVLLLWAASVLMPQGTVAFRNTLCLSALQLVRVTHITPPGHKWRPPRSQAASLTVCSLFSLQHSFLSFVCNSWSLELPDASNTPLISRGFYEVI